MHNENRVLELLTDLVTKVDNLDKRISSIEHGQSEIKQSLARMENEQGTKIAALFDGYTLRGDQIERLQQHLDERLDSIQNDLSYAVSKVAQHDRNIVQLNRQAR